MDTLLTGTGLTLEVIINAGTKKLIATYTRLDTGLRLNGEVTTIARPTAIAIRYIEPVAGGPVDFKGYIRRLDQWGGEIQSNQSFTGNVLPDLPLEVDTITTMPDGLRYEMKMGGFSQEIIWAASTDEVLIETTPLSVISMEAYLYYVRSLKDFSAAIEVARG